MATRPDPVDAADAALVAALRGPGGAGHGDLLTRDELADEVGVGPSVIEALEREGLLVAHDAGGEGRFARTDVATLRAGMALLATGLPLGELLDLGRRFDRAMSGVAEHAVDLFVRFVRDPIRGEAGSDADAARQLVTAFDAMLPAAGTIMSDRFRRLVGDAALARLAHERR